MKWEKRRKGKKRMLVESIESNFQYVQFNEKKLIFVVKRAKYQKGIIFTKMFIFLSTQPIRIITTLGKILTWK